MMATISGHFTPPGGMRINVSLERVRDSEQVYRPIFDLPEAGASGQDYSGALSSLTWALGEVRADLRAADLVGRIRSSIPEEEWALPVSVQDCVIAVRRLFEGAVDWADLNLQIIHGPVVDPAVNVALDETLAEAVAQGRRRPFLRLWEWEGPQVVLGSYQSYANELHAEGVAKHGITVTRRVSGGGTMFMEAENSITFSLVVPTALVAGMSFEQAYPFLDAWVMDALAELGVTAHYVPLNDIASDRGKIAGAAQKRWANGIMLHHVTMAYNMDTGKMLEVLRTGLDKVHDKGTRSAVKWVDPLRSQIDLSREEVVSAFYDFFQTRYQAEPSELTGEEIAQAQERCRTKFSTPEWTFRLA